MKLVLVGDPHITPDSIEEGERLMDFVYQTAIANGANTVVVMGDLHHCHALVRVEVTHFWATQIRKAADHLLKLVLLVGNHDMPGNASGDPFIHALVSYKGFDNTVVVDSPYGMCDGKVTVMPYYFDPQKFVQDANNINPSEVVLCHQTFTGAKYENNFPAADGVDPDLISAPLIISGHIHMQQRLGNKVIYIGSPRWMTISDANQERGIHVFDTETKELQFVSTDTICRPIRSYVVTPETIDQPIDGSGNARVIVTLKGPKQWVLDRVDTMGPSAPGTELRSVYVETEESEVKESDGLAQSLEKYVLSHEWSVPKEKLWNEIRSRITWFRPQ